MHTRIVLVKGGETGVKALRAAAERREVELVEVGAGEPLPPDAAAVAGQPGPAMLDAALAMADRTEEWLRYLRAAIHVCQGLPFELPEAPPQVAMARDLANALGLDAADRSRLVRAAWVYDIGKLAVPHDLFVSRELLTYDEWETLRGHVRFGAGLAEESAGMRDLAPLIRYHHENWDGTGYPEGLEGEAIPRLARVLKVIDVYCAMTTARPYRTTVASEEDARAHLQAERGKMFDPEVVDALG